ncbi:hypothetical protein ZIOFF_017700 [Zingiber officinale]|uniref:Lipoyl-binding domain-containing protein n=1 Tax=Zingiber officinale TaxID=94328 RepID=A0A8J5HUF7_ZINOF|nr:hypothetical protein ZIOFF_017700 [Zingiber officinale]
MALKLWASSAASALKFSCRATATPFPASSITRCFSSEFTLEFVENVMPLFICVTGCFSSGKTRKLLKLFTLLKLLSMRLKESTREFIENVVLSFICVTRCLSSNTGHFVNLVLQYWRRSFVRLLAMCLKEFTRELTESVVGMILEKQEEDFLMLLCYVHNDMVELSLDRIDLKSSLLAVIDGFKYSKSHEWVKHEGAVATIGITDHAQGHLGDVVFVELPEPGAAATKEQRFGSVESVKATSDVNSPVSGEVIEVNTKLTETPGLINSSPYEDGWMIKVKPSDPSELKSLMGSEEYTKFCQEEDAH